MMTGLLKKGFFLQKAQMRAEKFVCCTTWNISGHFRVHLEYLYETVFVENSNRKLYKHYKGKKNHWATKKNFNCIYFKMLFEY